MLQLRFAHRALGRRPMKQQDGEEAEQLPGALLGEDVAGTSCCVHSLQCDALCVAVSAAHKARARLQHASAASELGSQVDAVEGLPGLTRRLRWETVVRSARTTGGRAGHGSGQRRDGGLVGLTAAPFVTRPRVKGRRGTAATRSSSSAVGCNSGLATDTRFRHFRLGV